MAISKTSIGTQEIQHESKSKALKFESFHKIRKFKNT